MIFDASQRSVRSMGHKRTGCWVLSPESAAPAAGVITRFTLLPILSLRRAKGDQTPRTLRIGFRSYPRSTGPRRRVRPGTKRRLPLRREQTDPSTGQKGGWIRGRNPATEPVVTPAKQRGWRRGDRMAGGENGRRGEP